MTTDFCLLNWGCYNSLKFHFFIRLLGNSSKNFLKESVCTMFGHVKSYFPPLIALMLKYEEELINYPDGGRKVNSNFNECNLSRVCNNPEKMVKSLLCPLDSLTFCEWLWALITVINYLLEGLSPAHLLIPKPTAAWRI